jgi:hypothetical protein
MEWYVVRLPTKQTANLGNIQERFLAALIAAGNIEDMAMFCGPLADDGTPLYFTPATATCGAGEAFLRAIGATPCERPTEVEGFLVGDESARLKFQKRQL